MALFLLLGSSAGLIRAKDDKGAVEGRLINGTASGSSLAGQVVKQ